MEKIELRVSEGIPSGEAACDFVLPPQGSVVDVQCFYGEAPYSVNSVTKLCFGDPAVGPSGAFCIWTMKGSGRMPFEYTIPAASTDGVKAIGVCCDNAEDGEVYMSAYAKVIIV